ncbi:MAG: hypothetical protein KDD64_02885 [Bdellovibrionales bacterium]|nr:hypothetical protein [Bdellovibrionales bacterium]
MPDVHPVISSVPAVLLVVSGIFETLACLPLKSDVRASLKRSVRYLLLLLAVVLPITFYTGLLAGDGKNFSEKVEQAVSLHYDRARLLLFSSAIACLFCWISSFAKQGKSVFRGAYYFALLGAIGVALLTSYQGGSLVFEHGVGVATSVSGQGSGSSDIRQQGFEQEKEQDEAKE